MALRLHLERRHRRVAGEPEPGEALDPGRADARLAKIYVIVATAYPDLVLELDAEADQTFFKPVSYTQLHELAMQLGIKYAGGVN